MLIIPTVHISSGVCIDPIIGDHGREGLYDCDPQSMARLWRSENFKALHVVSVDGAVTGSFTEFDCIKRMTGEVDIPVQVTGGIRTRDIASELLDHLGAYRVVVSTMPLADPDAFASLLSEYGARKVIVSVEVRDGRILTHGRTQAHDLSLEDYLSSLSRLGVERCIYGDVTGPQTPIQQLKALVMTAEKSSLRVTVQGGISSHLDLKMLQNLHPQVLDSVILDTCLYQNVFPCQTIWRKAEFRIAQRQS